MKAKTSRVKKTSNLLRAEYITDGSICNGIVANLDNAQRLVYERDAKKLEEEGITIITSKQYHFVDKELFKKYGGNHFGYGPCYGGGMRPCKTSIYLINGGIVERGAIVTDHKIWITHEKKAGLEKIVKLLKLPTPNKILDVSL